MKPSQTVLPTFKKIEYLYAADSLRMLMESNNCYNIIYIDIAIANGLVHFSQLFHTKVIYTSNVRRRFSNFNELLKSLWKVPLNAMRLARPTFILLNTFRYWTYNNKWNELSKL